MNKKSLFVLPYVSIVTEKVKGLKKFGKRLNFSVVGFVIYSYTILTRLDITEIKALFHPHQEIKYAFALLKKRTR